MYSFFTIFKDRLLVCASNVSVDVLPNECYHLILSPRAPFQLSTGAWEYPSCRAGSVSPSEGYSLESTEEVWVIVQDYRSSLLAETGSLSGIDSSAEQLHVEDLFADISQVDIAMTNNEPDLELYPALSQLLGRAFGVSPLPESRDVEMAPVIDTLQQNLARVSTSADLASEVGTPEEELRRRLEAAIGLPFERYLRWARLGGVMREWFSTGNLQRAARAAGFASAQKFRRDFRRLTGFPISAWWPEH